MPDNSQCGPGYVADWSAHMLLVETQKGMATVENSLAFSYEVNHTHDLAISFLDIYPREKKTYAQKDSDSNVHRSIIPK